MLDNLRAFCHEAVIVGPEFGLGTFLHRPAGRHFHETPRTIAF